MLKLKEQDGCKESAMEKKEQRTKGKTLENYHHKRAGKGRQFKER